MSKNTCNESDDAHGGKDFDRKRSCISRFFCCHLPKFHRGNKKPAAHRGNSTMDINDDKQFCETDNTNSKDTMHGTVSPKKTSLLARIKSCISTRDGKKSQKDSKSTLDDPPRTSPVVWKNRFALLCSLATKKGRISHLKNTKHDSSQIQYLILEDQNKVNETTQLPINGSWTTSGNMVSNSLEDEIDQVSIFFQNEKQGNSVKPTSHIEIRTPTSSAESLDRLSQFMSLTSSEHGDYKSCCSEILIKLCNRQIQMRFFRKFRVLTQDCFRILGSESMNGISETVDNKDMGIGILSSTKKIESFFERFPDINDNEMFEEAETEIIWEDQILTQFPTSKGFQDQHLRCSSESMENPNLKYVSEILQLSGLLENEAFKAWHSLEQPLDPEMFEDIESSRPEGLSKCSSNNIIIVDDQNLANCYPLDHKLLFDLTNEVLVEIYDRTYTNCTRNLTSKRRGSIKPFPVGNHLLENVLANISRRFMNLEDQGTFEITMARDLDKDNVQVEIENVALEVGDFIFNRLVDEELQIFEKKN